MAFVTEENLTFIEEVQKYDCIYNKYSRDFKNKFKKYNCWVRIATKFDITPEVAEKRFRNIRTAYGRFLKKKKSVPSGSGRDAVPSIPKEFANLEWLSTLICHRKTTSNFKPSNGMADDDAETDEEDSFCSDGEAEDAVAEEDLIEKDDKEPADEMIYSCAIAGEAETQTSSSILPIQPTFSCESRVKSTSKKKRDTNIRAGKQAAPKASESREKFWVGTKKKPTKLAIDLALLQTAESVAEASKKLRLEPENLQGRKVGNTDEDDEDSLFCQSLAKRMQRLPSQAKAFVRIQIEQIMYQAEFNGQSVFGGGVYGRRPAFQHDIFSSTQNQPSYPGFVEQVLRSSTPSSEERMYSDHTTTSRGSEYNLTTF